MSEIRRDVHAGHEDGEIARDLQALVAETRTDLPTVHESVARSKSRAMRAGSPWMAAIRFFWMRPLFSTLAAVALGLFVVFGLPIPFEKTIGHDVTLTLAGARLDPQRATVIAREMKDVLGADRVRMEGDASETGMTYRLIASVPASAGKSAQNAATALAATLTAAGYDAKADVVARTERVSGTMYAFAADRIIRISTDGKSAAQIESELRSALAAEGFGDAQVSVRDEAGDQRLEIGLTRENVSAGDTTPEEFPQIVLTKNGQELGVGDPNQCQVRVKRVKDEANATGLVVDVTQGSKSATAEVANVDGKSDAQLSSEIQSQLDRAGLTVRVEFEGGKLKVENR